MDDIEQRVRRHDNYQFEIKLGYDLNRRKKKDVYRVESFFFIPKNLDVNDSTYSKRQFYRDLLLYIRFKTPEFNLKSLADPANSHSPFAKINLHLDQLKREPSSKSLDGLDYEMRLIGCILKSTLRQQVISFEKEILGLGRVEQETQRRLCEFLADVERVIAAFRGLRDAVAPAGPAALSSHAMTDEYLSLLLESHLHRLLQTIYAQPADGVAADAVRYLTLSVEAEIQHRRNRGYPSIVQEDADNENFLFRLNVLKKRVAAVLHLSVRTQEEGEGLKQFAFAMAAGIAMLFAASIAFYYQRTYGGLSLTFFVALVVSYMFKDRMKALSQAYFEKVLARHLFDQQTDIIEPFSGEKIGICRESVRFPDETILDPRARALREQEQPNSVVAGWRSETVMAYMKEITLFPEKLMHTQGRKTAVIDIARYDLRNLLLKMDEPTTALYALRRGRSEVIQGTRSYHVNVVIKFSSDKETTYERLRLVLTRDGIKRIEPLAEETFPAER